jgi:hypothetical protein
MISAEGRGFLIDWDLAELISADKPRPLGRTVSSFIDSEILLADMLRFRVRGNSHPHSF